MEANCISKVVDNFPAIPIVLYRDIVQQLNCEKLLNLRKLYNLADHDFGAGDYSKVQV